jgi:hypothetical protein
MTIRIRKTATIGGRVYILPFVAIHCWVVDAHDNNICECYNTTVATALATMLNNQHPC